MHTTSVWWTFPNDLPDQLDLSRPDCLDALRGLSKVMHTVATVGLMSDPRDLGFVVKDGPQEGEEPVTEGKQVMSPTIFMYDSMPGGVGLSSRVFDERQVLLPRAKFLLDQCACQLGCPTCIGPVQPETMPGAEGPIDRKGRVAQVIDWVLAQG
jgi:DEAD/DEAH box helicase domain-containing protein